VGRINTNSEVGMRNAEKMEGGKDKNEFGSGNAECGKGRIEGEKIGRWEGEKDKMEFGSGTRRRPKRVGLCRGKHAEKMEGGKEKTNSEVGMRNAEKMEGGKLRR
jgi:hypothetical protein